MNKQDVLDVLSQRGIEPIDLSGLKAYVNRLAVPHDVGEGDAFWEMPGGRLAHVRFRPAPSERPSVEIYHAVRRDGSASSAHGHTEIAEGDVWCIKDDGQRIAMTR